MERVFRIVSKSYRREHTGDSRTYYAIEVERTNSIAVALLGLWKPFKVMNCGFGDCYMENLTFDKLEEAQVWLEARKVPVPADKEIDRAFCTQP